MASIRSLIKLVSATSRQISLTTKKTAITGSILKQQHRFLSSDMEDAKKRVGQLTEDPGNEVKLKMYALYKQVSFGLI